MTGHWVHHPVPVTVEQNPYTVQLEHGGMGTEIPQGFKKPGYHV